MTNVEALKNLYVALGGSADDVANLDSNAAIINLLGNVAGGGGGGLVVTSSVSDGTATLDKTFAEIESAMKAGRTVVIKAEFAGAVTVYTVSYTSNNPGLGYYEVCSFAGDVPLLFNTASPDGYPSMTL